jgi:hypothetical protein
VISPLQPYRLNPLASITNSGTSSPSAYPNIHLAPSGNGSALNQIPSTNDTNPNTVSTNGPGRGPAINFAPHIHNSSSPRENSLSQNQLGPTHQSSWGFRSTNNQLPLPARPSPILRSSAVSSPRIGALFQNVSSLPPKPPPSNFTTSIISGQSIVSPQNTSFQQTHPLLQKFAGPVVQKQSSVFSNSLDLQSRSISALKPAQLCIRDQLEAVMKRVGSQQAHANVAAHGIVSQVPSLSTIPPQLEHAVLVSTQKLLENSLFHFAKEQYPKLLTEMKWEIPEHGELNVWDRAMGKNRRGFGQGLRKIGSLLTFSEFKKALRGK